MRIKQGLRISNNIGYARAVRSNYSLSEGHSFKDRQAKTLIPTWKDTGVAFSIKPTKLLVINIDRKYNLVICKSRVAGVLLEIV